MALKLLLVFALENNITSIHIYGDSQLIVNWVKGVHRCDNLKLKPLLNDLTCLKLTLSLFAIPHIYKEFNMNTYDLSKAIFLLACKTR